MRIRLVGIFVGAVAVIAALICAASAFAAAPVITEESALAGPDGAVIRAKIDPEGQETHCELQYVVEAQYRVSGYAEATSLPCTTKEFEPETGVLEAASHALPVIDEVEGLAFDTAYHFRFLAKNAAGEEANGQGATFATFGFEAFEAALINADGDAFTQAGGHPYDFTTVIAINHSTETVTPSGNLKDVEVELPAGLVGDPAATPRCSRRDAENRECNGAEQVGTMYVEYGSEGGELARTVVEPMMNVVPPKGLAADFSARFNGFADAFIEAHVRSGSDYGVDAVSFNITTLVDILRVHVTMWGVPGEASHDSERLCSGASGYEPCSKAPEGLTKTPFLSYPTSCAGHAQSETARIDSWQAPGQYAAATVGLPAVTGCGGVPFDPGLAVIPETERADSPTGLNVDLKVPQNEEPEGIATANLRDATITFPAGLTVNPSSANGLGSCSEEEAGFIRFAELDPEAEPGVQTAQFTPEPAECPAASKLGTVEVETPLIEHPLPGGLYLATPHQNPFGSLIAVYLVVYDPITGVVIKLPGNVELNQQAGRVTTTFDQNPQLPFEHLKVDLFGGERRPAFTTPATCGSYTTSSLLEPWSHKGAPGEEGTPDATPTSEPFTITEEPVGGACPATEAQAPNTPGFEAGTASPIAGTYSPFVLKLKREDGSQRFGALDVTLPPGMVGKIAGVEECPQADIEAAQHLTAEGDGAVEQAHPSCPAGSEVGVVKVGAGSGAPFYVTGHVYFAGRYEGAPFSFVIVTPAIAGPFDLGTVVVRAALSINPTTAQVSVKSDPFPTILDGIPLDLRSVDVEMTRPEFTLNPTSCDMMATTGAEASTAEQTASLSDRFQVGGCDTMPFSPSFSASTKHQASRQGGAALVVKLAQKAGEANLAKVEVELPIQFSARDSTLNHACTEAQFAANPSGCPEESIVGTATAVTPLLAKPLTGPAIYVSHGGLKFPDLDVVLQGEGITIDLTGKTEIEGKRTFSKFETVPDAPISSFELSLPEGLHSALAANLPSKAKFSYCGKKLDMATRLVSQNGATREQQTKVTIEGCGPELKLLGHKASKRGVKITVQVPSAGTLTATGKGLTRASKKASKAGTVKLMVKLTRAERARLVKRRRRHAKIEVSLRFQPAHGKPLTRKLKVRVG